MSLPSARRAFKKRVVLGDSEDESNALSKPAPAAAPAAKKPALKPNAAAPKKETVAAPAKSVKSAKRASKRKAVVHDSKDDEEDLSPLVADEEAVTAFLCEELGDDEQEVSSIGDRSVPAVPAHPRPKSKWTRRDTSTISCPIFANLCELILDSETYTDIVASIDQRGADGVWKFVRGLIDENDALRNVVDKKLWDDKTALLAIGGNVHSHNIGWYLDVVTDETDDEYVKNYVGQSVVLKSRINGQRSKIGQGAQKPLHYACATAQWRKPIFVVLAEVNGSVETGLIDLTEMYFCLLFQTLQPELLKDWLPSGCEIRRPHIGLNILLPLHQNGTVSNGERFNRAMASLRKSEDPETRAYYKEISKRATVAARAAVKAAGFRPISQVKRRKSNKSHLFRSAQAGNVQEEQVWVKCNHCGNVVLDPDPLYAIEDDKYLVREITCSVCPAPAQKEGAKKHNGQ